MRKQDIVKVNIPSINSFSGIEKENVESFISDITSEICNLVEFAKNGKFWDDSIKKIIITNDYSNDILNQAKLWGRPVRLTEEKEYIGVSKILFNYNHTTPERHIFVKLSVATDKDTVTQVVLGQFISVYCERIISEELIKYNSLDVDLIFLDDFIKNSLTIWLPDYYAKVLERNLLSHCSEKLNPQKVLNGFCRKLKRNLFEYNSNEEDSNYRLNKFWNKIHVDFTSLISLYIEILVIDRELKLQDKECEQFILSILSCIGDLSLAALNGKTLCFDNLKKQIISFYKYFNINVKEISGGIRIEFTVSPKEYFIDTLVDTEPRFVCFLDVLGFSEMVDEYDRDITSTVLQDLQEAFTEATMILNNDKIMKEGSKYLRYQMFSDCISISLPYFNNEMDFLANFNLISSFIRGLQLIMMSKGFFLRGGLSIGSYYSDSNMIFSKGLVNAYNLEQEKAIYPRVIVDGEILRRIENYSIIGVKKIGLDKYVIIDNGNITFLNPFNLAVDTFKQLESILHNVKIDDGSEVDNMLNPIVDLTVNLLKIPLRKCEDNEKRLICEVKEIIGINKTKYMENKSILDKYTWIEDLLAWIEERKETKFGFKMLFIENEKLTE